MTLGKFILNYITENKISMREFARKANVSHSYITYLVNGKKPNGSPLVPTIDKYKQIAQAMGMDVNDLIASVDDKIALGTPKPINQLILSYEEEQLVLSFRMATDRDRNLVKTILSPYEEDTSLSDIG